VGVEKIYLCGYTPSPKDRFGKYIQQLSKVALGAEKTVDWDASARSPQSIKKLIKKLKRDGYKIFAVEQSKKSIPYYKINLATACGSKKNKKRVVLILGNEVKGLPPSILKLADKILEIPMKGKKESLNVAVAFGIVAFRLKYC